MNKLKMHSPNITDENVAKLAEIFPNCVTEGPNGMSVDLDLLRQELSDHAVEGPRERYRLDWPGKRQSILTANTPTKNTLRPCREESVDFDDTENLFIEGDNLEALKLLQENYLCKVKMIYIDPPYNTGNDFIYNDSFSTDKEEHDRRSGVKDDEGNVLFDEEKWQKNSDSNGRYHSDWLSMMYPRLKLARNLLREDGVIFISIDDNEAHNLRKICDDVFGASNFIASVVWQRAFSPKNDAKFLSENHDYLMIYGRNLDLFQAGRLPRTEEANSRYKNPDSDPRGPWMSSDLTVKTYSAEYDYPIETPGGNIFSPSHGSCWRLSEKRFFEMVSDNRIWFGADGNNVPRLKRFLSEVQDGMVPTTMWLHQDVGHNQEGRQELKSVFDDKGFFDGPKPVRFLRRALLVANTGPNDIILDFFSGSSTTAHAVMQLNAEDGGNRRFIMVQLPEPCEEGSEAYKAGYGTIAEIGKERIRRAGKKILEGECHQDWNKDVGFRVLKVDSSNMADVYYTPEEIDREQLLLMNDNVKEDRTSEDLLFQVMLDWGLELSLPIKVEEIGGKEVYFVDDNAIAACFDRSGGITEPFVRELAARHPLRVVFHDGGFKDDGVKINVEQIFKALSPKTEVRTI